MFGLWGLGFTVVAAADRSDNRNWNLALSHG